MTEPLENTKESSGGSDFALLPLVPPPEDCMAYWLMKSEPGSYSWQDLVRDGSTEWDGVRNNAARLHLKAMKRGDEAFFYHSMDERSVIGIMRITREAAPDPKDSDWVS